MTFTDNNNLYTVKITGVSSSVLGDSPVIIERNNSEHLFKPCKYSSATIKLITDNYKPELYASTALEVKVELLQDNVVKWIGYVTPNIYNQNYEASIEELEIEAIDGLSTLQYYKYTTDEKNILSFREIIYKLLNKCNCYIGFYIGCSYLSDATSIIDLMLVSEQNFFDEDNLPMTMQEVLEEICKYLNVVCYAVGNVVYFWDLKSTSFVHYDLSKDNADYVVNNVNKEITLDSDSYSANGTQISLDNVYNKVIIKDSLYSFDSVIPDIWDDNKLTNWQGNWYYKEEIKEGSFLSFFRYYKHKNYTSHYYSVNYSNDTIASYTPDIVNYETTKNYMGATICRHCCYKSETPATIQWEDYILLHLHRPAGYNNTIIDPTAGKPLLTMELNDIPPAFIAGNAYFVIQGSACWMDLAGVMYKRSHSRDEDDFNADNLYINCSLQVGDLYWNGSFWNESESIFKLYFDSGGNTDHYVGRDFTVKNNVVYTMGIPVEGYAIPMPNGEILTGKPKFDIYASRSVNTSHRTDAIWLKNFDIKCVLPTEEKTDKDSDTEYSNVINEDFIEELEDSDFKICTWDNKEVNYSAVAYSDGLSYHFIDKVLDKNSGQNLRPEEHRIFKLVNQYSSPSVKMTVNIKNSLFHPNYTYRLPVIDSNKKFVVDSYLIDYRYNRAEVTLIEIK